MDRGHGWRVILAGVCLTSLGLAAFTQVTAAPAEGLLLTSLLAVGLGTGCLMAPLSAAAYSVLDRRAISRATSLLNVVQRLGGAVGTAAFAIALQRGLHTASEPAGVAEAFADTFRWPLLVSVAMVRAGHRHGCPAGSMFHKGLLTLAIAASLVACRDVSADHRPLAQRAGPGRGGQR